MAETLAQRPALPVAASSLNTLGDELLDKVFSCLDSNTLLAVCPFVCKRW